MTTCVCSCDMNLMDHVGNQWSALVPGSWITFVVLLQFKLSG